MLVVGKPSARVQISVEPLGPPPISKSSYYSIYMQIHAPVRRCFVVIGDHANLAVQVYSIYIGCLFPAIGRGVRQSALA